VKNVQKIAIKKKTSEIMNRPTPIFSPFCTAFVWIPKNLKLKYNYDTLPPLDIRLKKKSNKKY